GSVFKSDTLVEQGKEISATEDLNQAHYNQLLADKGTPLEILAGQYGGEAIHMGQMGKISAGLMNFAKTKFAGSMKFLTRVISSLPFAAKAGTAEFHDTYAETGDALTSNAVGLGASAVTALMSQWDGVLNNIEAAGLPYIPEIVGKLSTVPGSGALAGVGRWGKAFGLWLGNVGKTAVNEFLQEPAENVATTFLTDLIKGKNPLDRDWKEYSKELMSEGVGAAIISLGSSAATLPPYARTAKVIESQLGKSELTAADVETFVNAMKEDMKDPQIVEEAQKRAENIAVEVRTGELVSDGGPAHVDTSASTKAKKSVDEEQKELDKTAEKRNAAGAETLAAHKAFNDNPSDANKARFSAALKAEQAANEQYDEAVTKAQAAQAELETAQASEQAQSEAVIDAARAQARAEVQTAFSANVESRVASDSVSEYNGSTGGVMNGEEGRGYDGRGSSGSNVEGRGGSPQNDRLDSRTAIEGWSPTGEDRAEAPGVITRASKGYEAFEKAVSNSGLRYDDGEPIILYHGTRNEFETMGRMDFAGGPQNYDTSHGIYLTNDINVANLYSFMYGNIEGRQSIHPVALNTDRIARFDADGFGQDPDYQNYVALLIEKYNKYAGKENFSQNLEKALARELAEMNIEEH
ncbi:MAG: hypothetical protein II354_04380, partial [Firmicutes bacterium]|nr:hypothetical protein [Bacillota bacterium]